MVCLSPPPIKQTPPGCSRELAPVRQGFLNSARDLTNLAAAGMRVGFHPAGKSWAVGWDCHGNPGKGMLCLTVWKLAKVHCKLQMRVSIYACLSMVHSSTQGRRYLALSTHYSSLTRQFSLQHLTMKLKIPLKMFFISLPSPSNKFHDFTRREIFLSPSSGQICLILDVILTNTFLD